MLFSRGHAVGSMHWAQLAKHEAEAAERELAEVRASLARTKANAKADSPEVHAEDLPTLQPEEFTPEPIVPKSFDTHVKEGGSDDSHPSDVVDPKPFPGVPKRGPGRPRKDGY
jgi:hypothetical protein